MNKNKSPLQLANELVEANLGWYNCLLRAGQDLKLAYDPEWSKEAKSFYQKALDIQEELEKISIDWGK